MDSESASGLVMEKVLGLEFPMVSAQASASDWETDSGLEPGLALAPDSGLATEMATGFERVQALVDLVGPAVQSDSASSPELILQIPLPKVCVVVNGAFAQRCRASD